MKALSSLGGGLAGAVAVTLINESIKKVVPQAPRLDLLGINAVSRGLQFAGLKKPDEKKLYTLALVGDLISNSLYYAIAGVGKEKNIWVRSSVLGLAAGIGAVTLPEIFGLENKHTNRSTSTKLMTVGLYVAGALITTAVIKLLEKRTEKNNQVWERRLVTSAMG